MLSILSRTVSGRSIRRVGSWGGVVVGLVACAPSGEADPVAVAAAFGEPLPGLTDAEVASFEAGRLVFRRAFRAEEGLGPRFNENACNACHTDPVDGGTGETAVTKATRLGTDGVCDALASEGGENLRIRSTLGPPGRSARVPPPPAATHVTRFTVPFLFGVGVIDAIAEETLRAREDPDDRDGDGVSGRLGADAAGRPARFGRKADVATLADFVDGAFRLEMGLTTAVAPDESRAGALPPLDRRDADPTPEPEIDQPTLDAVVTYLRLLAPPRRARPTDGADADLVLRGEALFHALGCPSCHVPTLVTGPSVVAALDGVAVDLYSDLLLHDMGPGLEGVCTAHAGTREYRTEPLMGLRARRAFLHDGRYGRVTDAILAHDGEARAARDAFASLDRVTQQTLIRFLDTL